MLNIQFPSVSPLTILLMFQLVYISHSFYGELSNKVKFQLENNKLLRHLIIFLMVLVVVSEIYKNYDMKMILLCSVIIYVLLVALTRISASWFIGIFIILCIYQLCKTRSDKSVDNILSSQLVNFENKEKISVTNTKDQIVQCGIIVSLIIIGVLIYEQHKKQKHQEQFKLIKFIFNK